MSIEPESSACENDMVYCKFGADRLNKLLDSFANQIQGVIEGEDVEFIHRMRVASRRIRATMPLFSGCFPQKKFKRWLKETKRITRLLGEARDLDVQIAFIEKYKSENETPAKNAAVDLLLKSHRARRTRIQPCVEKGLNKLRESRVLTQMKIYFDSSAKEAQDPHPDISSMMEKAYWAISGRIDDLQSLEEYVHQENEILKHHEMRIKAKWLRYTMETFAPLYPNQIGEEIEAVKNFQDLLGEMHDCDVWIALIQKLITENKKSTATKNVPKRANEFKQSLLKFLEYVEEQRRNHYIRFGDNWEQCKKAGLFEKLRATTSGSQFPKRENLIEELRANPKAEIAVLADVHANLHGLKAVIENAEKRGVRIFLNAGDLVGFGPCPNEVLELLHSKNVINVIGNFDLEVLDNANKEKEESRIALEFTRKQLASSCRTYLSSLPKELRLQIDDRRVLLTHGSPESIDEHLYHDTPAERLRTFAENAEADIVITGHSHEQYVREVDGAIFLNPGSVGRPGDGNPQAAYAVIKSKPFDVELLRVDYNVSAAAETLRRKGLPESFAQMLLQGVPIDRIIEEDRQRREAMARDCRKATENCEEISKQYLSDMEHQEQVRKLSLSLFDQLQRLHKLGNIERCWLECAAILHDIGISKTTKAHNKESMKLILNDTRLLLPSTERRVIASIARYHRKGSPKKKHYNLASLSAKTVRETIVLSGILRVADSLDYTHKGIVHDLALGVGNKRITVKCTVSSQPTMEEQAFAKKRDLIEKVLKKKMVLTWKQL